MLDKIFDLLGILVKGAKLATVTPSGVTPGGLEGEVIGEEESEELLVRVPVIDLKTKVLSDDFINELKKQVFPFTPIKNIQENWPLIVKALEDKDLLDEEMVCYSLATVKVECEPFKPLSERPSKYSTLGGLPPYNFSKYDKMTGLGNTPELDGDGEMWKGRGFISITGFNNYKDMDQKLNLEGGLLEHPEAALEPHISAFILVQFLYDRVTRIRKAFATKDLKTLRKIVNGGLIGFDKFQEAYLRVEELLEA